MEVVVMAMLDDPGPGLDDTYSRWSFSRFWVEGYLFLGDLASSDGVKDGVDIGGSWPPAANWVSGRAPRRLRSTECPALALLGRAVRPASQNSGLLSSINTL